MLRKVSLVLTFGLIVAVGVLPASALIINAVEVSGMQDPNGDCSVVFTVITITVTGETDDSGGFDGFYVITYDGDGNPLASDDYAVGVGVTLTDIQAVDDFVEGSPVSRPFRVVGYDIDQVFPGQLPVATVQSFPVVFQLQPHPTLYSAACAALPLATEPEPVLLPGCDVLMPIPATAVGGTFVADAPVYWKPGELTSPLVTIKAGNSARVLGLDASGQYYKIIWVCDFLWVPKATLGPNYDGVWHGAPLPTGVVE